MKSQAPPLHERYEQISVVGRGGAGTVYLVHDRTTGERIALKRLLHADTQSLLRLKREFRSLSDLHHPNLVKLYELGHDKTSAFFTMEYLEGKELKRYLDDHSPRFAAIHDKVDDAAHINRVLSAFRQLASGVTALHRASVLHRDLKPTNVMIVDGRVVILDFGIAVEVGMNAATVTQEKLSTGTPAYMAPEQVQGSHLGEANDWYAFGAMLYEALSGSLPIEGQFAQLLVRKITEDPEPLDKLVPNLPREVSDMCMRLLHRSPTERPSGDQVLHVLRAHTDAAANMNASAPQPLSVVLTQPSTARTGVEVDPSLFGREPELATLWSAFRSVQAGSFAAVHVSGESGAGKSLLVHHFTEEVERAGVIQSHAQPLVLRSRCYERETLPFKALDGAIDALVNHLMRESEFVVSFSMPRDMLALTQLFPVFNRLPTTKQLLAGARPVTVASQARAHAEVSLSDLLRRLASQRPIVLWIDDLQWGDLDSVGIITNWLTSVRLPHVMLVLSYRSEETSTSPCLQLLRERAPADPKLESTISLSALGDDHVRELCKQRFELARVPVDAQANVIARIVREAQGSPFLASQLAALAVAQPHWGEDQLASLTLEQLVRSRSATLSGEALRTLNVLSVAGRPIPLVLAMRAAQINIGSRAILHELQGLHLIRTREVGQDRLLEVYHDRLREVVTSLLTPEERLELDRSLLTALHDSGTGDSDWLHVLAFAVGERSLALRYGVIAAERARETLAFERAAELYERCLALAENPAADGGELWEKLALAYAHAGHGNKAAAVYLNAATQLNAEQSLRFERAAASHLLCTGRFDEGEALVRKVLSTLGIDVPNTQAGQYAALAWERTRLAVRGIDFTPRARSQIDFKAFFSAEFLGMLSMETAAYDPLRAAVFQARCTRLALEVGEPESVARALCAAATMQCVSGSESGKRRADELLAKAEAISRTFDSSLLRTNLVSAQAICAFLTGDLVESIELSYQAEQLHRTSTSDSEYHHRFTIVSSRIGALLQIGEYRRAETELQVYLKEAAATENINAELLISMARAWADIIAARADQARERLDRQLEQLPQHGFGMLHVLYMIAVLRIGCATGDYDWALRVTHEQWRRFQHSVVRRSERFSAFAYEVHARLLLCRAAREGTVSQVAREVASHIKVLSGCSRADSKAEASRIKARIAFMKNDRASARRLLEESLAGFEKHGARDQAARDRYALGVVIAGEPGQTMMRDALVVLAEMGIVDPLQSLRGHFPELLEPQP